MAVKGGLGRGLGSKGKGIDSIIPPSSKSKPKTVTKTTEDTAMVNKEGQESAEKKTAEKKPATKKAVEKVPAAEKKTTKKAATSNGKKTTGKETEDSKKVSEVNTELTVAEADPEIKVAMQPVTLVEEQLKEQPGTQPDAIQKEEVQKPETYLKVSDIEPNRQQPRKNFDEDTLLELADSIRQYGVLSPILVQKNGDYYEIIAGERRWGAAKLAGLKEVPVIVREYTKQEVMEIALIENIQRENLNPIEEAVAFKRLLEEFGLKQDELADRVSKSRTAVTNSMRLLKLDERVQRMLIDEMISSGHARALLGLEDPETQYSLALRVFDEKLSVRDIEKLVRNIGKEKMNPSKPEPDVALSFIYRDLEERITGVIGTKVTIHQKNNKKGKIEISYHSNDELERLTDLLLSLHNQ